MEKQWMSREKLEEVLDEALDYVIRVGDATSQLANVAILFGNNANESISGRSHRLSTKYTFWKGMKGLVDFIFQDNHCERAYFNDVERAKKTVEAAEEAQNS